MRSFTQFDLILVVSYRADGSAMPCFQYMDDHHFSLLPVEMYPKTQPLITSIAVLTSRLGGDHTVKWLTHLQVAPSGQV